MMKKILSSILFLSLCFATATLCQAQTDSVRFIEYLPITHTDGKNWVTRYQQDIDRYQQENRQLKSTSCDVLFLGNSSINLWDNIYEDMKPLNIIRRSYGGATIRDMIYNYETIARGFHPKSIVLYVENDLASSPEDLSVGETYDFFRIFINRLKRDYLNIPLFVLSFKPSHAREKMIPRQKAVNSLLEEYAAGKDNIFYLDVASTMYDKEGKLRKDIFKPDNLHMNQTGYHLWTAVLKPRLLEVVR